MNINPNSPDPKSQHCVPSAHYKYSLRDRSFRFGLNIVKFVLNIDKSVLPLEIRSQLLRSGTSVGANIEEADDASSRKDFANKFRISRREAKETKYWLRIIKEAELLKRKETIDKLISLTEEVDQLIRIMSSILKSF